MDINLNIRISADQRLLDAISSIGNVNPLARAAEAITVPTPPDLLPVTKDEVDTGRAFAQEPIRVVLTDTETRTYLPTAVAPLPPAKDVPAQPRNGSPLPAEERRRRKYAQLDTVTQDAIRNIRNAAERDRILDLTSDAAIRRDLQVALRKQGDLPAEKFSAREFLSQPTPPPRVRVEGEDPAEWLPSGYITSADWARENKVGYSSITGHVRSGRIPGVKEILVGNRKRYAIPIDAKLIPSSRKKKADS